MALLKLLRSKRSKYLVLLIAWLVAGPLVGDVSKSWAGDPWG
jgi:hypothetical protein